MKNNLFEDFDSHCCVMHLLWCYVADLNVIFKHIKRCDVIVNTTTTTSPTLLWPHHRMWSTI